MLVYPEFYLNYFIYGLFLVILYFYLTYPVPNIYEFQKEKFNNICNY